MTLPGPNGGNVQCGANSVPNSGPQDPGLHSNSQEPGPSSHPLHHYSTRPVFYIHAPPPPPFLHYQWPMPFSYNPFAGFPGMGYGMVMPPFPATPYMETPAYVLPHPHIQAVDYRRLLHPQVHAHSALHQNPNQTRGFRPPHIVPVRETVNSEVQTEPTHRGVGGYGVGSQLASSDSGHGTASSSPSSSSSSQKRGSAKVENSTLPSGNAEDFQVNRTSTSSTVKHGFNIPHPTGIETIQSCIKATPKTQSCKASVSQVNVHPCRSSHCNMWSVSSQDSMVPVCSSSQQEDEVVKERRVSIPDILMSWGVGTPQATILKMVDKVLPPNDHQLLSSKTELEHEKCVYQSPAETQNESVVADSTDAEGILSSKDSETLFKILKLPFALYDPLSDSRGDNEPVELVGSVRHCLTYSDKLLHSLNKSHKLPFDEQTNGKETNIHDDTTEIIPYQMPLNSCQTNRKMNESVWSVESLAPFIPTKEWLLQNGMFDPEVIVEMTEEAESCRDSTQNDNLIVKPSKRRQTCMFSSSDSVPMSDSWLIFSTPAQNLSTFKKPEIHVSEMRGQGKRMDLSIKDPLTSPTCLQSKIIALFPTANAVDEYRSSEPGANQSPNLESLIVNVQQEKNPCSPEKEATLPLSSAAGEKISSTGHLIVQNRADIEAGNGACGNEEVSQLRNEQLCVPMTEVSPSKAHLVDCGIQCTEFQEPKCSCEKLKGGMVPNRRPSFKYTDMKKANDGNTEGFYMNGHMQKNQKRHGQWRNRGSEKHSSQQEAYNGYPGKLGKSKGGNGRNPRY
ncbi:uncharacterized protein LOC120798457 isoform X2 [Xiphias gladius]|uniref:uncharacterized protein LOC120798457 isoform X2 n=1 Tax=Xiphias gladius TaxID=8245 RepID=UPI001A98B68A|nr:uncharacterized protein LOC120798457 isoform X2 [Xiphias gladius]